MEEKCIECEFRRFMEKFGQNIDYYSCWIDCTPGIRNELQEVFGKINSMTYQSKAKLTIYAGNADKPISDMIASKINQSGEDGKIHINDFLSVMKKDEKQL